MLNRSFVLFKTLAEDKPPVADREYLVAIKDEDGEASFKIAKWYEVGQTVNLEYKPEFEPEAKTAEERLIKAIFGGAMKTVTVKTPGFYIVTSDYGQQDNEDCSNELWCINEEYADSDVSWAELPFAPKGTVHPYDAQTKRDRARELYVLEKRDEYIQSLESYLNNNEVIKSFGGMDIYANIIADEKKGLGDRIVQGLVLSYDYVDYLESHVAAAMLVQARDLILKKYGAHFIKQAACDWENDHDGTKYEEMHKLVMSEILSKNDFCVTAYKQSYAFGSIVLLLIRIICMSAKYQLDEPNYYLAHGKGRLQKYVGTHLENKFEDMRVLSVVIARALERLNLRTNRYVRLCELGAPDVIRYNEFRILASYVRFFFQKIVCAVTPEVAVSKLGTNEADFGGCYDFASQYGITTAAKQAPYDPSIDDGDIFRIDKNGLLIVPYKGVDVEGNEVRYSEPYCEWDPGTNTFCMNGVTYTVTRWHRFFGFSSNIEELGDGRYRVPDIGVTADGHEVKYDASKHRWDMDSNTFSDAMPLVYNEDGYCKDSCDDAETQVYAIKSYREFDKPDAYFDE